MVTFHKLMLVTNREHTSLDQYLEFIKMCAISGITSVQLRDKHVSHDSSLAFGRQLKKILALHNIPLIINDNTDLALKLDAHGVHLGQTDGDPKVARTLSGSEKIIGVSIDSYENLSLANTLPIDYVGVGAIFKTDNKPNARTVWGLHHLKKLSKQSKHPIVAIGGINISNADAVMSAGAEGIAVIGAIHNAENPAMAIQSLRKIVDRRG